MGGRHLSTSQPCESGGPHSPHSCLSAIAPDQRHVAGANTLVHFLHATFDFNRGGESREALRLLPPLQIEFSDSNTSVHV